MSWSDLRRSCLASPLTTGCILLSSVLYGMAEFLASQRNLTLQEAQVVLGGVSTLELWRGELWRVPVSSVHHAGGLPHLILNCLASWHVGRLAEARLGIWRFAAFLAGAVTLPIVAELLIGNQPLGLSGAVFAMFGVLWTGRRRDDFCATHLPEPISRGYLIWLWLCIPLTYLGLLPVANVAHFSGLAYGGIAGLIWLADWKPVRWSRVAFWLGHIVLVPATWLIMHPIWDARYFWWLGNETKAAESDLRDSYWRRATELDPNLGGPWFNLTLTPALRGDFLTAWRIMLTGLKHNPAYAEGIDRARLIWNLLPRHERGEALRVLRETFGGDASKSVDQWEVALTGHRRGDDSTADDLPNDIHDAAERFRELFRDVWPMSPDTPPNDRPNKLLPPRIDPHAPNSAAEGQPT
jgi:membrane associated rhomboid family serine protease